MLKRLTRKLFILFVLCAALTAVLSNSSTNSKRYCVDMPIDTSCPNNYLCCDRWGNCTCA